MTTLWRDSRGSRHIGVALRVWVHPVVVFGPLFTKSTFGKNKPTCCIYTSVSVLHMLCTETSLSSITRLQQPCFIVLPVREGIPCLHFVG